MLRAAQMCQILHQFQTDFCFLLFSLKMSGLGIYLHLLKLLLMLAIARTQWAEALAAARLLDRSVQSQWYFFMKISILALDRLHAGMEAGAVSLWSAQGDGVVKVELHEQLYIFRFKFHWIWARSVSSNSLKITPRKNIATILYKVL